MSSLREFRPLQAPFIKVRTKVVMPGMTNGVPNIKYDEKYVIAPSGKKIATYIVNQIFGSDLVTQTEGLNVGWLMPTLKEGLEQCIYDKECFIYLHKFENKVYLECINKNYIFNLLRKRKRQTQVSYPAFLPHSNAILVRS